MFLFVCDEPSKNDAVISAFLITVLTVTIVNVSHALNN